MNHLARSHSLTADRYEFDCGECAPKNGFIQIDTYQDAPYFGVWTNPLARKTVTFAEGEITRSTFDNGPDYAADLRAIVECYDHPRQRVMFDVSENPDAEACLDALGFGDRIHGRCAA